MATIGIVLLPRANFVKEAKEWREDARSTRDGFTFFYFAGHGVQRKQDDAVILLEDFGDPDAGGPLNNAVDFNHLFRGMAPPAKPTEQIANRQIYFVDACRIVPREFSLHEWINVPDLFKVEIYGKDERHAPVFFAAVPGAKAYALKHEQTLFSKALLACFNEAGVEALREEDGEQEARWVVTVHSLNQALTLQFDDLNEKHNADQDYIMTGRVRNMHLIYLDHTPEVDVRLKIDPADAVPLVQLQVSDAWDREVWNLHPVDPHPYQKRLRAGIYGIRARIASSPPPPPYYDYGPVFHKVEPPSTPLTCKLMKMSP